MKALTLPSSTFLGQSPDSREVPSIKTWIGVGVLLFLFAGQNILEMRRETCTSDEVVHLPAGFSYLTMHDFRMNPEHPPLVKILAAMPLLALHPKTVFDDPSWRNPGAQAAFGYKFLYSNNADLLLFWARMPIVLIAVLLGFYVFRWAEQLYGQVSGFFALGLYAFSPNIIAHAHLVTMDVAVGAFLLIAFYYLWRHLEKKEKRSLYWSAIAMGAALASKFSAVVLFPVAILFLWTLGRSDAAGAPAGVTSSPGASKLASTRKSRKAGHKGRLPKSGLRAAIGPFLRLDRTKLISVLVYFGLAALVVQIAYLGSLDPTLFFKGMVQVNKNHNPNFPYYLHGNLKIGGWWYYFLVAFLVKATSPFVILVMASLAAFIWKPKQRWRTAAYLLIPSLVFLAVTSALADPLGVRYILPLFPFLMVFSSGLWKALIHRKVVALTLWILLGWHVTSSLAAFPNHIPYFNEFVGGSSRGTEWLDDSNVDWGQGLKVLKKVLDEHGIRRIGLLSFSPFDNPEFYGIHCFRPSGEFRPVTGYYALSAHVYARNKYSGFDWKKNANLIADVGHSMYIFKVGNPSQEPGKPEDAVAEFTEAIRQDPNSAEAHSNLGNALQGLGRLEEAAAQYLEALRLKPNLAGTHYSFGNALQGLGRFEEAAAQYREALSQEPNSAEAHGNLGVALTVMGGLEEAVTHLKEAVRLRPDYAMAHNNLGNALQRMGRFQEAVTHHKEALRLKPDFAEAYNGLGHALQGLGRLEDAATQHKEALRLKPDFAEAHYNLGNALQGLGRYKEAVAQYREVLMHKRDSAEVYNSLGVALACMGQLKEAAMQFKEALRLKPDYADAQVNLAKALTMLKKSNEPTES